MKVCKRRKYGLVVSDIWFSDKREYRCEKASDFAQYHDQYAPLQDRNGVIGERYSYTLLTNLSESEDDIISHFRSNVRNEVRRAQKENVHATFFTSKQLLMNPNIIRDFDIEYCAMYKQKGIGAKSKYNTMMSYAKNDMILISVASQEDQKLAYHAYIYDEKTTRLLHSVSVFRESEDNAQRAFIGRANRMLHYEDMLFFKRMNCSIYDWGGYSMQPELKGISDFKASFGGKPVKTFHYIVACSIAGKIAAKVKGLSK